MSPIGKGLLMRAGRGAFITGAMGVF